MKGMNSRHGQEEKTHRHGVLHGIWLEELLERIHSILTRFGYEVWMSHKGTVPVISTESAFENCLHAVEQCDLFLTSDLKKNHPSLPTNPDIANLAPAFLQYL